MCPLAEFQSVPFLFLLPELCGNFLDGLVLRLGNLECDVDDEENLDDDEDDEDVSADSQLEQTKAKLRLLMLLAAAIIV